MKKTQEKFYPPNWKKTSCNFTIKVLIMILIFITTQSFIGINDQKITLKMENVSLEQILWKLKEQTKFEFAYSNQDVASPIKLNINVKNESLDLFLKDILNKFDLEYKITQDVIVINKKIEQQGANTELKQQKKRIVNGFVTDKSKSPLPGVSVMLKGTSTGVATDIEGKFTLSVSDNLENILIFSFIGMQTQEIQIGNQSEFVVELEDLTEFIDEVLVVAYGTTKKSSFSGSAAIINSKDLIKNPSSSFEKALQGKIAGLQVATASGQPGATTSYRIRGSGSLNASNEPLYVIDGVATTSSDYSIVAKDAYSTSSILASINPQDIESITVLKDAAAASLYGSRAANGVVIITTKSGKQGDGKISLNLQIGAASVPKTFDLMNSAEYYKTIFTDYYKTRLSNGYSGTDAATWANNQTQGLITFNPYNITQPYDANGKIVSNANIIVDTDWQDEVFNPAMTQDYNLSFSGGTKQVNYFFSGGYFKQDGTSPAADYSRYSFKSNITTNIKPWLRAGMNTIFSYSVQNTEVSSGQGASPLYNSLYFPNGVPVYQTDSQGNYILDEAGNKQFNWTNPVSKDFNPLAIPYMDIWKTKTYRLISSLFAEIKFMDGLKFKTTFSPDYVSLYETKFWNKEHGNGPAYGGRSERHQTHDLMYTSTNTLNYTGTFSDIHNVSAMLGSEVWNSTREYALAQGTNFAFNFMNELAGATNPLAPSSYTSNESLMSYFARAEYNYDNKYYFSASFRRDGSSVFGANNKWGNFYSFGGSWRLEKENFLKDIAWINALKLRSSYGTSGNNQGLGRYQSLGLWSAGSSYNYANYAGFAHIQLANPDLGWEKQAMFNIGVDYAFLNHRLYGSLEYYNKVSTDLLYNYPLPTSHGFALIMRNLAKVKNAGVEFELGAEMIRNKDFNWNLNFNLSTSSDKILDLADTPDVIMSTTKKIWKEGYSQYEFYMPTWAGVDKETGAPLWVKGTGTTSTYSAADNQFQGKATPDCYGGLTNSFSWKGIDFSFFIYYSVGGLVYDGLYASVMHEGNNAGTQLHRDVLNGWTTENTSATTPKYTNSNSNLSNSTSSRFLYDATYFKLKNVNFSYTLPKLICQRLGVLNTVKVYFNIDNLFTWFKSDWKGYDDIDIYGIGGYNASPTMPLSRTYTFGVNFSF